MNTNRQSPAVAIDNLRQRVRQHVEDGAITARYTADRDAVLRRLNAALATEPVWAPDMVRENPVAERAMRRMLESVLAVERKHADEPSDLLQTVPPRAPSTLQTLALRSA
ncbi:MAG: hypothetical protein KIT73_02310 [Burkholderiales bacterium]|nr:hypothetical protein [Burkholderiales bacterium]